jgi:hypothetical protein
MSRPPHSPRLYNSNYTLRRVQIAAPCYTVFSTLPSLNPSCVPIFSSAPCSHPRSMFLPLCLLINISLFMFVFPNLPCCCPHNVRFCPVMDVSTCSCRNVVLSVSLECHVWTKLKVSVIVTGDRSTLSLLSVLSAVRVV